MPSSVQFENTYPEDERWIDAGAYAFALHFAACCYADRRNTDGTIPKSMVSRVALAVPAESVETAVESLIGTGFWTEEKTAYRITNYLEDKIGLPAEEKLANRARWAEDKRWRRKHNAGNHADCPPEKCRQSGVLSHSDSQGTPRKTLKRVQEDSSRTTRPDSIRLDSTRLDHGVGEGGRVRAPDGVRANGSAGATPPPSRLAQKAGTRTMPNGFVVTPEMVGGVDPNTLDQLEVEGRVMDYLYPDADSLDGLIPADGAAR